MQLALLDSEYSLAEMAIESHRVCRSVELGIAIKGEESNLAVVEMKSKVWALFPTDGFNSGPFSIQLLDRESPQFLRHGRSEGRGTQQDKSE